MSKSRVIRAQIRSNRQAGKAASGRSGAIARADAVRAHGAGTASLGAYELYLRAVERKQAHRSAIADLLAAEDDLKRASPGLGRFSP